MKRYIFILWEEKDNAFDTDRIERIYGVYADLLLAQAEKHEAEQFMKQTDEDFEYTIERRELIS